MTRILRTSLASRIVLREGDRLAVVGPTGAGKSALLRELGDQLGHAPLEGRFPWMDRDCTGAEIIRLRLGNGPAAEMASEFCGLGEFLDLPLRCYSTGMQWRLGFTLATVAPPPILLVDRPFWGGDLAFRERVRLRIEKMVASCRIAVLVNSDTAWLERRCERAVWLEGGRIVREGRAAEVLRAYRSSRLAAAA